MQKHKWYDEDMRMRGLRDYSQEVKLIAKSGHKNLDLICYFCKSFFDLKKSISLQLTGTRETPKRCKLE